jgi:hypothetical protein
VLLDHGLYKQIDDDFRHEYAGLWRSLVLADHDGIRRHSAAMNAGDAYVLFACERPPAAAAAAAAQAGRPARCCCLHRRGPVCPTGLLRAAGRLLRGSPPCAPRPPPTDYRRSRHHPAPAQPS